MTGGLSTRSISQVTGLTPYSAIRRYSTVAMWLHWAIAALILVNWPVGFLMEGAWETHKRVLMPLHASIGITVLALTAARVAWRLTHRPPPFFLDMAVWERGLAHAVHGVLYFLMMAMPLTGWFALSAHPPRPGQGPVIWGLFHLPPFPPVNHMERVAQKVAHGYLVDLHIVGAWTLAALLILHLAGALKHQFYDGHAALARMGLGWTDLS